MNPTIKKAALLVALLGVLGVLAWSVSWMRARRATAVRLSSHSAHAVPRTVLANDTIYRQRDPQWAGENTGGSGETLGAVGCTVAA